MNLQAPQVSVQLPEKFKAAWWLRNRHLQTIAAKYLAPKHALDTRVEMLALPDGDHLQLNWTEETNLASSNPLVVVLHGLEGNIHSHYASGMLKALTQQGFSAVLMHFRGCNGEPNRLPRAYHSGDTADLAFLIAQLKLRFPQRALAAIGFSLGGNVVVKYVGETGKNCPLQAAVSISAPLMLAPSSAQLEKLSSKLYKGYLLNRLKKTMQAKLKRHRDFPLPITHEQVSALKTLREFDDLITAPLHGFINAAEYYTLCSGKPYLKSIHIPTLLVHAKDDPFLSQEVLPKLDEMPPWVHLLLSEHGGHVGFVGGRIPFQPTYYLEEHIPRYLAQFFKELSC